jgi:hypothetical protein
MFQNIQTIQAYLTPDPLKMLEMHIEIKDSDVEVVIYRNSGGLVLQVKKQDVPVYKCILRNVFDHPAFAEHPRDA